jgi:hypothetical protein
MNFVHFAICLPIAFLAAGTASAQQMMIFPNKGQDQAQQDTDRGACHVWAVNQSGFDPANVSAPPPSTEATRGGTVRGAGRGAAAGAAIGAIAGNAGRGAAIGAAGGGITGTARRNSQRRDQQAQANAHNQQQRAGLDQYNRALTACLEGKGYTVR